MWTPLTLLTLLTLASLAPPLHSQLSFGGSSGGSNSDSRPPSQGRPTNEDTDNRFFFGTFGNESGTISGSSAVDTGVLGLGAGVAAGAIGAAVLGPALQGATANSCGRRRRRRQANFGGSTSGGQGGQGGQQDTEERFFLPSGGSCTCGNGRKKRQAPGETDVNNRFFGGVLGSLLSGGANTPHCGNCCFGSNNNFQNGGFNNGNNGGFNNGNNQGFNNGNNQGFNNGNNQGFNNGNNQGFNNGNNQGFNNGGFNSGGSSFGSSSRCQCDFTLTFRDSRGSTHGACRRADSTGRRWCYTTGWTNTACGDLKTSKKFPNNPWSYRACTTSDSRSSGSIDNRNAAGK